MKRIQPRFIDQTMPLADEDVARGLHGIEDDHGLDPEHDLVHWSILCGPLAKGLCWVRMEMGQVAHDWEARWSWEGGQAALVAVEFCREEVDEGGEEEEG